MTSLVVCDAVDIVSGLTDVLSHRYDHTRLQEHKWLGWYDHRTIHNFWRAHIIMAIRKINVAHILLLLPQLKGRTVIEFTVLISFGLNYYNWKTLEILHCSNILPKYDDVIKWKDFPRCCHFVRGNHRWPVDSPHKGQWCGALIVALIYALTNGWANNRGAGDLRRHRAHYDATVMRF